MIHKRRKTYPGRKVVQGLQAGLVVAVGLIGLGAADHAFRQQQQPEPVQSIVTVVEPVSQPVYVQPEPQVLAYTASDYHMMALNAQTNGDYSTAIEYYTRALELDPSYPATWLNRGVAYEQLIGGMAGKDDFWQYLQRNTVETYTLDVAPNQTTTLDMAPGRMYILSFSAQAGDIVNVYANSVMHGEPNTPGVADPMMLMMDGAQNIQAGDDDTLRRNGELINMDASIDNYMIMRDGTYTVLLSHAGGGSTGMVDVTINVR